MKVRTRKKPFPMWLALGVCLVGPSACKFQTSNSFSDDSTRYGDSLVSNDPVFAQVQQILKTNCASCHAAFPGYTESQWVANHYVVAGDPTHSTLYTRLRGANVGGVENMPQSGALPSSEIQAIYDWIKNLETTSDSGELDASQRLAAVKSIFTNRCASCHNVTRAAVSADYNGVAVPVFVNYTTDNQFVVSGLIIPDNVDESWLFQALKTWGTINTMPKNTTAITETEAETIRNWIEKIGEP